MQLYVYRNTSTPLKISVYTAVFGGYDILAEPKIEEGVEYRVFTDDIRFVPRGWSVVKLQKPSTARECTIANRKLKIWGWKEFLDSDVVIYIDGNVRIVDELQFISKRFLESGCPIGLVRHPIRLTVWEELEACLASGKIEKEHSLSAQEQVYKYLRQGFSDENYPLTENNIIFYNPKFDELDEIGNFWEFEILNGVARDQISLPYVAWKLRVRPMYFGREDPEFERCFIKCSHRAGLAENIRTRYLRHRRQGWVIVMLSAFVGAVAVAWRAVRRR